MPPDQQLPTPDQLRILDGLASGYTFFASASEWPLAKDMVNAGWVTVVVPQYAGSPPTWRITDEGRRARERAAQAQAAP
jgi:hypothetical protein